MLTVVAVLDSVQFIFEEGHISLYPKSMLKEHLLQYLSIFCT